MFLTLFLAVLSSAELHFLSINWRPTHCRDIYCDDLYTQKTFINRFWQTNNDGELFESCYGPDYEEPELDTLEMLSVCWDIHKLNRKTSWKSEWETDGICFNPWVPEEEYFKKAIETFLSLDIEARMDEAGIIPSVIEKYSYYDLGKAVGNTTQVECEEINGETYLKRFNVCYDSFMNKIKCIQDIGNCSPHFYIPPIGF